MDIAFLTKCAIAGVAIGAGVRLCNQTELVVEKQRISESRTKVFGGIVAASGVALMAISYYERFYK